ncbi:MAG: dethiobiotin synthase [Deltaproteobacteria bacterium]|nr:dethiobiotin synthase [Deltaproteobacteria bacterium]
MGTGIFITGVDTGVGKTFVACGLASLLRDLGYRVGVMKPAEAGCAERDGELFPEDAVRLKEASGCQEPIENICPYRLSEPLAPSIAAERAGVKIDIDHLLAVYNEISAQHDMTLVEGAGGLMVPLLPSYTYADLAKVLKLPLIVVAANRLGAINHLVLTLEHASCKGLRVLGYVLNHIESPLSLAAETNREVLANLTAAPCLAELPFLENMEAKKELPPDWFKERLEFSFIESVLNRR